MMDNKFWMNVWAVIVAMLLMSWVVRPVLGGVLGVKEGMCPNNRDPFLCYKKNGKQVCYCDLAGMNE